MSEDYGKWAREAANRIKSYLGRIPLGKVPEWLGLFRYFPAYVRAICKQWAAILFGESVLAVAFLIWWALGSPPLPVIFASAVVVAGFFVWCAEYLKNRPQFEIKNFVVQPTPIIGGRDLAVVGGRVYIQLKPQCLTDTPAEKCKGYLIAVYKKNSDSQWEKTRFDEVAFLKWSSTEDQEITLEPRAERRLDVCYTDSSAAILTPHTNYLPSRAAPDFRTPGTFSFDIKLTAENCRPVLVSISVTVEENQWDKPKCALRQGLTMDNESAC